MIYMADRKCATADTGSEHSVCKYESMRILFMNFFRISSCLKNTFCLKLSVNTLIDCCIQKMDITNMIRLGFPAISYFGCYLNLSSITENFLYSLII